MNNVIMLKSQAKNNCSIGAESTATFTFDQLGKVSGFSITIINVCFEGTANTSAYMYRWIHTDSGLQILVKNNNTSNSANLTITAYLLYVNDLFYKTYK